MYNLVAVATHINRRAIKRSTCGVPQIKFMPGRCYDISAHEMVMRTNVVHKFSIRRQSKGLKTLLLSTIRDDPRIKSTRHKKGWDERTFRLHQSPKRVQNNDRKGGANACRILGVKKRPFMEK